MSDVVLGGLYPLTIHITDSSGVLADAGTVTVTVTLPDGTTATPTVDHPSLGVYQVDYPTVQAGLHTYRWLATGVNATSAVGVFNVATAAPRCIVSLAAAKRQCKIDPDVTEFDDDLMSWVEAATKAVEDHVGETVVRRTITDIVVASAGALVLPHTPVISVTSVATLDAVTTWDVADLDVDTTTGVVRTDTGPRLRGRVRVTYTAGRTVIPGNYLKAALIIIEHLWQTTRTQAVTRASRPGMYEDSLSSGAYAGRGYAIPNRALELLGKPAPMVG